MSYHEKYTWAFGVVALLAYGSYLALVLPRLLATPVAEIDYAIPLIGSIGGAILGGVLIGVALGATSTSGADQEDERDRRIARFGDNTGNAFAILGGIAAMALAMLRVDPFWIANSVYLCFILAAVLSSIAKIAAYRKGLPEW